MLRVISNKRIDITDDEWIMFNKICDSYKEYGGEVLFQDLFETDKEGIIQYIKPPSKQTSLEIFLFIVSIFNHQHIRKMHEQVDDIVAQLKNKLNELNAK